jgi:DNA sulfur modification protein DndB
MGLCIAPIIRRVNMTENVDPYLAPLLTDSARLRREAGRRRKPFDEKGIPLDGIVAHQADGWEVDRQLKRITKVRREKEIDERLENRFWMLLFKMGYPEMNDGRSLPSWLKKGSRTTSKASGCICKG